MFLFLIVFVVEMSGKFIGCCVDFIMYGKGYCRFDVCLY